MGRHKHKKKTVKPQQELTNDTTPRSFVFHRGVVGKNIHQLITDMRHLMEPYTAVNLRVTKSNVLKDFVHIAGPYGISHFITFSKTEISPMMRICRLPRGPTLTFRLNEYTLMRDITAILKRPKTIGPQFKFPPLVVLNNFDNDTVEMKLMTTMFQNMFPAIRVHKIKLTEIKRCALFNYDKENNVVDFRHFNIEAVPVGVNKGIKRLLKTKIPDLGKLNDISDLITGGAYLSESEGEEPGDDHVTLPQRMSGRGNLKSGQSAIRLTEMGPRLKLELVKIEEGVSCGEVLYHKYVEKNKKEKKELKRKKEEARKLKKDRRLQQEANVKRKEEEKDEHKQKCLAGLKRKNETKVGEENEGVAVKREKMEDTDGDDEGDDDDDDFDDDVGDGDDEDEDEEQSKDTSSLAEVDDDVKKDVKKAKLNPKGRKRVMGVKPKSKVPIKGSRQLGVKPKFKVSTKVKKKRKQ